MKLSVGQLLRVYLKRNNMTQSDLAKKAGCSRAMVNHMVSDRKRPGEALAEIVALILSDDKEEEEGLKFFLLQHHKKVHKLLKEYPHAFEDFRTAGNREDDKGLRIY